MLEYNIKADALSDEDANRLAEKYPHLAPDVGPYEYCPTCDKTGKYLWRGQEHECDCFLQLQLHKHYLNCGIGDRYQRLDWDDWFGDPELVVFARDVYLVKPYVQRGTGLFLWGDFGAGKTMIATLILKELIKRGLRCYAITVEDLVEEFTKGWARNEDKRWFERKIKYCDVLLLDDLGKERNRGNLPSSTFNNLLRARVQGGRTTIITSNDGLPYLTKEYGESTVELMDEATIPHEFVGASGRHRAHDRDNQETHLGERRPIV